MILILFLAKLSFNECRAHFSELFQWAAGCYGDHSLLLSAMGTLRSESGVQQGDPLGPLLFCLVLHKVVTAIAADSICSQLSFHSWYMDDGVIAGPKQAALQALHWVFLSILPNVNCCSKGSLS